MVQKINPHPAPGCNSSPPTMYFQKMQFLGVFRPFLQRSLAKSTVASNCQQLCKSPHTIFFHDFLISVSMQCPKIGTTLEITRRKNGFVLFLAFSAQYTEPGRQCRIGMC